MRCTSTPAAIATISFTSGNDVRGPGDHKKRTGATASACWPLRTGGPKKPWLSSVPKFPSSDDSTASASAASTSTTAAAAAAAANVTSDSDSGFGTDLSSLSSSPCSSSSISGSGGGGAIPKQLRRGQGGGAPSS